MYAYLTLVVALPAIRSTALPPRPNSWYQDLYWHLSIAADLTQRVPPNVPQVAGRTLRYHWFSDAHLAASHLISGVPLPTVLVRLWLLPVIAVVLGLLVAVAHRLSGRLWPGAVAAALNAAPAMLVPWRGFRPPTTGVIVPSSPSQVYGVVFLLLAVDVLIDVIRGQRVGRGWLLVVLAVAAASGSKPSVLPVLLVGLCCALAVNLARRRAVRPTIGAAVLVVGVLALSARTVAGSTSGSSLRVGGILAFLSPWRRYTGERALTGTGGWFVPGLHPGRAAVVAGLLGAVLLLQYTWVLCGLPLLRRPTRADPAVAALAGSTLAGLTALLVLDHPSASQIYFALTAAPLAALLAGWGLACALAGPTTDSTWRRRIGASSIGLTAGIAVAVVAAVTAVGIARASAPRARTSAQIPFALAQPMIVLLLLGLLGTAGWLVLRRSRPGLRGGGVGVLCLALVAGSLLTEPPLSQHDCGRTPAAAASARLRRADPQCQCSRPGRIGTPRLRSCLSLHQLPVGTALSEQLGVGAALDDAAILHYQDQVGPGHRTEPVSDHDPRATEPVQVVMHRTLGERIEIARRLVQQQDRGTVNQGPGQREALLLTTGKGGTSVHEYGSVPQRHRRDIVVDARKPRCFADCLIRDRRVAERDVVPDCRPEDIWPLGDDTDLATHRRQLESGQVDVVEENSSGGGGVEAE